MTDSSIVLKDGTVINVTPHQLNQLRVLAVFSDINKKKVKLGGRIFLLSEIETDPVAIQKLRQTGMKI